MTTFTVAHANGYPAVAAKSTLISLLFTVSGAS